MSKIEVDAIDKQSGSTLTLGGSGTAVTLASGATQSGFGRTGTVDWQTGSIKTSTFTATNGEGYFCNTTSGGFTVNLPAGSAGAIVSVQDYNNTFDSNALTVSPNGSEKINSGAGSIALASEGEGLTLVYIDGTVGWRSIQDSAFSDVGSNFISATGGTITESGDDKIHTFTGPGTFTVSSVGTCAANNVVSYLVVAGGAGGASGYQGGGGGAGGFREVKSPVTPYTASPLDGYPSAPNRITVTATAFPITVGGGGAAGAVASPGCIGNKGADGANSIFSTVTSAGGGAGGAFTNPGVPATQGGNPGGSGGGAGRINGSSPAGTGNTPPTSPAQGTNGGSTNNPYSPPYSGGGGGGATVGGTDATGSNVGTGGAGATTSINGTPTARAGGGGGGGPGGGGTGGSGGGGNGGSGGPTVAGEAGTVNTGGGGGSSGQPGCGAGLGGAGGSGIVIIRYKFQ